MNLEKLAPGDAFPITSLPRLGGGEVTLGAPSEPYDWQLIVVYRGKHCPLCTRYLSELDESLAVINGLGIEVVAVSADPLGKAQEQVDPLNLAYAVGYELNLAQMQALGVYISHPRSAEETDRPFAEPAIFIVNQSGILQIVDLSNVPFVRPHIPTLIGGLGYIRDPQNNYPIRGTYRAVS